VHVVIIGAGEVGWYLAERLSGERHDVAVIEADPARAAELGGLLDVRVVTGSGSSPAALTEAGVSGAGLLAAVTDDDEVNLVVSLLAKQLGVGATICRLQREELRGPAGTRLLEAVGADLVIDPDADTAEEILHLVRNAGADEVYPMTAGLTLIGTTIRPGAALAGRELAEIARSFEPNWEFLFGALTRQGETSIPRGNHRLEEGDHVRVLATREGHGQILDLLGVRRDAARRVMVLGGGAIGSRVATQLERARAEVVLVERDPHRAAELGRLLHHSVVVRGDVTDTELLAEEAVGTMDVVVAATGEDASNVLACAYAAAEGATFTVAVLHRLALLPLIGRFGINAAVSPRTASANAVLRYVRGGLAVATFLESDAEVDELVVEAGSKAAGATVSELHLPREFLIGAVTRPDGTSEIVRGRTVLGSGDHIVVFARPGALGEARPVFQP